MVLDEHKSKAVEFKIIWSSSPDCSKYKSYFSLPELIEFPTEVPGQIAYAYFYPPTNPDYQAGQGEKPPLLLKSHGMLQFDIFNAHLIRLHQKHAFSASSDLVLLSILILL